MKCYIGAPQIASPAADNRASVSVALSNVEDGARIGYKIIDNKTEALAGYGETTVENGAAALQRKGLYKDASNRRVDLKAGRYIVVLWK